MKTQRKLNRHKLLPCSTRKSKPKKYIREKTKNAWPSYKQIKEGLDKYLKAVRAKLNKEV